MSEFDHVLLSKEEGREQPETADDVEERRNHEEWNPPKNPWHRWPEQFSKRIGIAREHLWNRHEEIECCVEHDSEDKPRDEHVHAKDRFLRNAQKRMNPAREAIRMTVHVSLFQIRTREEREGEEVPHHSGREDVHHRRENGAPEDVSDEGQHIR